MPEKSAAKPKRMYNDKQIRKVLEAVEQNPDLAFQIYSSAQSGNSEDIQFLLESRLAAFSDCPGQVVFDKIPKNNVNPTT